MLVCLGILDLSRYVVAGPASAPPPTSSAVVHWIHFGPPSLQSGTSTITASKGARLIVHAMDLELADLVLEDIAFQSQCTRTSDVGIVYLSEAKTICMWKRKRNLCLLAQATDQENLQTLERSLDALVTYLEQQIKDCATQPASIKPRLDVVESFVHCNIPNGQPLLLPTKVQQQMAKVSKSLAKI
eukprot:m.37765 g.37765  ORF g.37765 m.37765 type:complete len:186 (+) comp10127_c0_seq1:97-654(+)